MPGIGMMELVLVGVVALLVFGPKRLPEMGRSLGRGLREFKDSVSGNDGDEDRRRGADEVALPRASEDERIAASRERERERDTNTIA